MTPGDWQVVLNSFAGITLGVVLALSVISTM